MGKVKHKRLSWKGETLVRLSNCPDSYDLFSVENKEIKSYSCKLMKTDISIKIPRNTYGRIAPHSGLTLVQVMLIFIIWEISICFFSIMPQGILKLNLEMHCATYSKKN